MVTNFSLSSVPFAVFLPDPSKPWSHHQQQKPLPPLLPSSQDGRLNISRELRFFFCIVVVRCVSVYIYISV